MFASDVSTGVVTVEQYDKDAVVMVRFIIGAANCGDVVALAMCR